MSLIYAVMVCELLRGNTCAFPDGARVPIYFSLSACWTQANTYNIKSPQADPNHPRRVWQVCYQRKGSSSTANWEPAEDTDEAPRISSGQPEPRTTLAQSARAATPVLVQAQDPPSGLPLKWVLVGVITNLGPYPVALESYPSLAQCKQAVRVLQQSFNTPAPNQAAADCVGVVLPTSVTAR